MDITIYAFDKTWKIAKMEDGWYLYNSDQSVALKIAGSRMLRSDVKKIAKAWLSNQGRKAGWIG